ncbi:MAG: PPK2 family polyphosphate kinase [Bacteroidota bacterium]
MIKVENIATKPPKSAKKSDIKKSMKNLLDKLADLQYLLQAQEKYSLLVILQGMDASGKDGITSKVFGACSPGGINVHSFKKPTDEEFAHDFLWRVHKLTPRKGMITVFNRSHYEDVLIQRVHGWISEEHAEKRIAAINAFEDLLAFDNNTIVLKFFLHISKDQQKIELQQRIDEHDKHWKHNEGDWRERKHWDKYMHCYNEVLNKSTTPWHVIPMDERWYGRYLIAEKLVETLEGLGMQFPALVRE